MQGGGLITQSDGKNFLTLTDQLSASWLLLLSSVRTKDSLLTGSLLTGDLTAPSGSRYSSSSDTSSSVGDLITLEF